MDTDFMIKRILEFHLYEGSSITISVGTIVFIVLTYVVAYFLLKLLKTAVIKFFTVQDSGTIHSVFNFFNYFVYLILFFFLLNAIGVNINMFLTTTAALFVGLGFALQQIFQDLIAGIYIILDKTIHVGDIIEVNGKAARINQVNLRCTIVETRNSRILVIPNRKFIDDVVSNWTQDSKVIRAKIEVGVFIGTDVRKVEKVLLQSLKGYPEVLEYPKPLVMLDSFGESSIRFSLNYYIDNAFENDKISSDLRFRIDELFKENDIKLPVPVLKLDK